MLTYYDSEIKEFNSNMKQLVNFRMDDGLMKDFVQNVYPAAKKETARSTSIRENQIAALIQLLYTGKGLEVPGLKGTGWHAFNALTEYVNHERTTRVKDGRNEAEVRFEAINFGSGNDLMQRGLNSLLDMSSIHNELTTKPEIVKFAY
jgi:hypothetical protein